MFVAKNLHKFKNGLSIFDRSMLAAVIMVNLNIFTEKNRK